MENKRWGLIILGLCLALGFSVSSVAANNNCKQCQRCDRDGDLLIRDTGTCIKQCKPDLTTGIDDNDDESSDNCPMDDENFISLFEVTLTETVTSTPAPAHWDGSTSGGRTIHLPVFNPLDMSLDLSFFSFLGDKAGATCFPGDDPDPDPDNPDTNNIGWTRLFAASIQSKNVKDVDDPQAIGMFWFNGKDKDGDIDVGYVLQVFGTFSHPNDWPELFGLTDDDTDDDTNTLTMTDFKMQVESTKKGGRKNACNGEGNFFPHNGSGQDVMISVKQTQ